MLDLTMNNMIQTHIINLPRPWKVFFDYYGHLHLHAASMICVEERSAKSDKKYNRRFGTVLNGNKVDFHTYPIDSLGSVFTEAKTTMSFRFLDIREGDSISVLSGKFASSIEEINSEAYYDISTGEFIEDLKKCGIQMSYQYADLEFAANLLGYEKEELDISDRKVRIASYQLKTQIFSICKYFESKSETFEEIRQKFLDFLIEELAVYREYATNIRLSMDENNNEHQLDTMVPRVKKVLSDFNYSIPTATTLIER